jgi:hypothetical protein
VRTGPPRSFLDGAGREWGGVLLRFLALQFLAQPGHRAIEVVQVERVGTRDGVVGPPLLAGPIRARDHDPVEHGGEDRPLDREGEGAACQQFLDHRAAASLLPQAAENQRRTDPPCLQPRLVIGVVQRREQHDLLAEPGAGGEQGRQATGAGQLVEAPQGGDDLLADGPILAPVFDNLQVTAWAGRLDAKEHGALRTGHHETLALIRIRALSSACRGTTLSARPRARGEKT